MSEKPAPERTLSPRELDRLINHLREQQQTAIEVIGGYRREFKTDDCLAADYLEALRSELPHWLVSSGECADEE